MLMDISVRNLNNDMIKPSENGGLKSVIYLVTQKFLISDKTLRLFIPPQVWKMNPGLRKIWKCELFIIPKYTKVDLNIYETKLLRYLQQNSDWGHTRKNIFSTINDAYYKEKLYPDCEKFTCYYQTWNSVNLLYSYLNIYILISSVILIFVISFLITTFLTNY